MSYVIKAVLSNPQHPECGQITIPFPIPADQYDQTIEMLRAMDLGHSGGPGLLLGDDVEGPLNSGAEPTRQWYVWSICGPRLRPNSCKTAGWTSFCTGSWKNAPVPAMAL